MREDRLDLRWWLYGLAAFAVVLALSAPLEMYTEFGIVDHQAAVTAERANIIQTAWREAGLRTLAIIAIIADLIFIGIYSYGSWRAGRSCRGRGTRILSSIAALVAGGAIVFCLTDYVETTLQLVQMVQDQGSDWMAVIAAFAQPIKMLAWMVTFVGVVAAMFVDRFAPTNP